MGRRHPVVTLLMWLWFTLTIYAIRPLTATYMQLGAALLTYIWGRLEDKTPLLTVYDRFPGSTAL